MLTDWERHGAQVPLTRTIIETPPPTHVGTIFTARTGVSRITFDDRMEVVVWRPPWRVCQDWFDWRSAAGR